MKEQLKQAVNDIIDRLELLDDLADSGEMLKLINSDWEVPVNPYYHESQRFNYAGNRLVRY